MQLRCKDGVSYNLVKSAAAFFYTNDERLYSDGAVEMTLEVPLEDHPQRKHHSWCRSNPQASPSIPATGKAETRSGPPDFAFENGDGKLTGASTIRRPTSSS